MNKLYFLIFKTAKVGKEEFEIAKLNGEYLLIRNGVHIQYFIDYTWLLRELEKFGKAKIYSLPESEIKLFEIEKSVLNFLRKLTHDQWERA